jgi:parallel beta-helix repeat protein
VIASAVNRNQYNGTGTVGPFAYNFRIFAYSDLRVIKTDVAGLDTVLTYLTHYTATGAGNDSGTVTLVTALAVGEKVTIKRQRPTTQQRSVRNNGVYFASTHEDAWDDLTMQIQNLQEQLNRSTHLAESRDASLFNLVLPDPTLGAVLTGTGIGWTMAAVDSSGLAVVLPGENRITPNLTAYLFNNREYNVADYYRAGITPNWNTAFNAAIVACNALGGGRVRVPAGTYAMANVQINMLSNVRIVFDPGAALTYNWAGSVCFYAVNKDSVGIEGMTASGLMSLCVVFDHCTKVYARKNYVSGCTSGAHATGYASPVHAWVCDDVDIEDNYFYGNGFVTNNPSGADIQINGNGVNTGSLRINIRGNRCLSTLVQSNIAAYDVQKSTVHANICTGAITGAGNNNGYGIMLYKTVNNSGEARDNAIFGNVVYTTQGTGIYVQSNNRVGVTGNLVYNCGLVQDDTSLPVGAIAFNAAPDSTCTGNVLLECGKAGVVIAGILAADISRITITANAISTAVALTICIYIRGAATDCIIKGNVCRGGARGIGTAPIAQNISNCTIDYNAISGSASRGIDIYGINDSSISNNKIRATGGDGMALVGGSRNKIANNIVRDGGTLTTNTYIGIDVVSLVDCDITGNHVGNSGGVGFKWGIFVPVSNTGCRVFGNYCKGNLTLNYNVDTTGSNAFYGNYDGAATYAQFFGVRQQMVLEGAASSGAQLLLGSSSLIGAVGVRGNGNTDVYLAQNAVQVFGGDNWHQSGAGSASKLMILRINGDLEFYSCAAGAADAAFAAFWGTPKITLRANSTILANGTQVLATRSTGWTAMTGTATKAAAGFDTATVTLPQLAQVVKALLDSSITHGFNGA